MPSRERYIEKHRDQGLCIRCPNEAMPGRYLCPKCARKQGIINKNNYEINRSYRLEYRRNQVDKYKKEGRCTECSAPLDEEDRGFVTCLTCRIKATVPRTGRLNAINYAHYARKFQLVPVR